VLFTTNHRIKKSILRLQQGLLVALFCAALPAISQAEATRWYDVEVIIFAQTSKQFRDSEVWPVDVTLPDMKSARSLQPATSRGAFSRLSGGALRLNSEAKRIQSAPELQLLLHEGWRQPGLSQNQAVSVRVQEGSIEDPSGQAAASYRLEGTLKLVLSRYLHINADLVYREPMTESEKMALQQSDQTADENLFTQTSMQIKPHYRIYRLQQSRRMRSNELHYLDNPVLGMIIRVTPLS